MQLNTKNSQIIQVETIYKEISFMAPYIDIIDDFTVSENMKFHFSHKKSYISNESEMLDLMKLPKHKKIRNFSSGMRQKLKLSLSLFTESTVLLLDEPGSFLDIETKNYFRDLLQSLQNKRMVIIASNEKNDLESCTEIINIEDYK